MGVIVKLPDQASAGKTASSLIWESPPASCLLVSTVPSPGQVVFARQKGGNKIYSAKDSPFKVHDHQAAVVSTWPQREIVSAAQCTFQNTHSDRFAWQKGYYSNHFSFRIQKLSPPISRRCSRSTSIVNSHSHVKLQVYWRSDIICGNSLKTYKQATDVTYYWSMVTQEKREWD